MVRCITVLISLYPNSLSDTILVNEIAPRPHNSGHYTIEACATSQYENHLRAILSLPLGSPSLKVPSAAMLNILGSSTSFDPIIQLCRTALEVPGAAIHLYGKSDCRPGRKMGHITLVGSSDAEVRANLRTLLAPASSSHAPSPPEKGHSHPFPLVGIIMGSDSDLPTMLPAARILDSFSVPYELTIVSAHRTPDRMRDYARGAASRGLRVVIAGAGGAAHLPGMVAAMTPLPVIGVPVKGSVLDGVDSMYSILQMPVRSSSLSVASRVESRLSEVYRLRLSQSTTPQTLRSWLYAYWVRACRRCRRKWRSTWRIWRRRSLVRSENCKRSDGKITRSRSTERNDR